MPINPVNNFIFNSFMLIGLNFRIHYWAQNINEVKGLMLLGTFSELYDPSDVGYKILVGSLSGRGLSDTMEANV